MTIIDKLNQLLQKAINYAQEGLRQEGFNVDFQSATNTEVSQYDQNGNYIGPQAYPQHPNLDPNMYPQEHNNNWYPQQQIPQSNPINIEINAQNPQQNQGFINIDTEKHQ